MTPVSRDINDLHPLLRPLALDWMRQCNQIGLEVGIICTARSYLVQAALYAQGRESYGTICQLRVAAGLGPIKPQDAAKKVTWTLNSKHIIRRDDQYENNDYAFAWDFVVKDKDHKITWDVKADTNANNAGDYFEAGDIAQRMGLVYGGHFKNTDPGHIEANLDVLLQKMVDKV